jgi:hypothetical protein
MYELHKYEQYFFDQATISHLADFVAQYHFPCCLCAPLIGQELERRGVKTCTLDLDERFAHLRGYRPYDLARPEYLGESFGIIVCDPPFFNISLDRLFRAVRVLSRYDYTQPLLLCYLTRRSSNVIGTFSRFGLERIDYRLGYQTVQSSERNEVVLFGNLGTDVHSMLMSKPIGAAVTS